MHDHKRADTQQQELRLHELRLVLSESQIYERTAAAPAVIAKAGSMLSVSEFGSYLAVNEKKTTSTPDRVFKDRFNWRLILNPRMLMLCTSIYAFSGGTTVVYSVLPALADEAGELCFLSREKTTLTL